MQWFYIKEGQSQGPVELSEIRAVLVKGDVTPDALVWNEAMGQEWLPIIKVPEFADAMLPTGATVKSLAGPEDTPAPKSSLKRAQKEETPAQAANPDLQRVENQVSNALEQSKIQQPILGYACPRCGTKVKRALSDGAQKWAGLVGLIMAAAVNPMFCPRCGTIPRKEFPFTTQVRMNLGSLALFLIGLLLIGLVFWLYSEYGI